MDQRFSTRSISSGHPKLIEAFTIFDREMGAKRIGYILTSVFRSFDDQRKLYAQGRSTPGKIVTNAMPGHSAHNYGCAFDIVIIRDGKCIWDSSDIAWQIAGDCGKLAGLAWGGDRNTFREFPHFELSNWHELINQKD